MEAFMAKTAANVLCGVLKDAQGGKHCFVDSWELVLRENTAEYIAAVFVDQQI